MTTTSKKSTAHTHTHCMSTDEKNGNSYFLYNYKRISSLSLCIVSARSQINGDPYVQYDTISIILNHFSHFHLVSSVLFPILYSTFSTYIFFPLFLPFCRCFFFVAAALRTPTCAALWVLVNGRTKKKGKRTNKTAQRTANTFYLYYNCLHRQFSTKTLCLSI